jgi:hypothetical protein
MAGEGAAGGEGSSRRGPDAGKPGASGLGVDLAALDWQRSGADDGAFEVAFVPAAEVMSWPTALTSEGGVQWVLLRVVGDPAGRVLVYDRTEWLSFLDGAANGEFDWAVE